jgi:hypothetical protein
LPKLKKHLADYYLGIGIKSFNRLFLGTMPTSHNRQTGFSARAIHFGYEPDQHQGALVPPIYNSATYAFPDAA